MFTKARHEKALARDLVNYQIPFFLPLVPRENRMRGRTITSYIPLFSSYVFLYATDEERSQSRRTNHIAQVLDVPHQAQLRQDLVHLNRLILGDVPRWQRPWYVLQIIRGKGDSLAKAHRHRVQKVTLASPDALPFYLDGEFLPLPGRGLRGSHNIQLPHPEPLP